MKKEFLESNTYSFARRELEAIGYDLNQTEEGPNKWIVENLFELLEVFVNQGHSGGSAPYCANTFKRLALFEPLGPLTGEDSEWNEVGTDTYQNNRCFHVFKEKDGRAYDGEGIIFKDENGNCFTNIDSRVYITFPYTPTKQYKNLNELGKYE